MDAEVIVDPLRMETLTRHICLLLELPVELERLVRDPKVLGLVETELRLPLLGFAMLRRDVELEGETTFVLPDINFWGFENLKV